MIEIFTPSYADEAITNAQALTVKEIVSRLDPEKFKITMLHKEEVDSRIAARPNTRCLQWKEHGNTIRFLQHYLFSATDLYFYPHEGPLDRAVFATRRYLKKRTAIVTHIVSGGLDGENVRSSLQHSIHESDAVFGNNRYVSHLIEQRFATKAETIHNGIDRRYFFPSPDGKPPSQKKIVLYAGSFRPYKRVDVVVRQAARLPQVEFRIVGEGEEKAACLKLARELGCQNINFLGHLPQSELGNEMRLADVFFFPSVLEGHPQVLGQAAGCGLPSVALNNYRPDYVRDGETGFLVSSHEEMDGKLDLLLSNPELRGKMAASALEHARNFDWDKIARRWQEVFEQVVARRRGQ